MVPVLEKVVAGLRTFARNVIVQAANSLAEKYAHDKIVERPVIKKKPKKSQIKTFLEVMIIFK